MLIADFFQAEYFFPDTDIGFCYGYQLIAPRIEDAVVGFGILRKAEKDTRNQANVQGLRRVDY